MYFHGLSKDEILYKKRFESYEESSKQNQTRMVTLFRQQVKILIFSYLLMIGGVAFVLKKNSKNTSSSDFILGDYPKRRNFVSGNGQVNRNCLNPLMKDCAIQLPANHESVECGEFHSFGCSQDTIELRFPLRIEAYGTNLLGKKSEKVDTSDESGLLDLNKSPANELVSNDHQCFFQDLNFQHTEETKMSFKKSGLDGVHENDCVAYPASCCTAENNSRTELEDSCELIQKAAECLLHISAFSLYQSHDTPFKPGSTSISSSQDQEFLNKHEMVVQEPGRSCDSFELHTLEIRETIPEEVCSVSSKAIDDFRNKKEFGVKLRRGRRMKNFQKKILPELVPFYRHEIRGDINLFEAVLRSREYKKMQGKAKDGKCIPNPRNNKGLAQRYVGRRRRQTR